MPSLPQRGFSMIRRILRKQGTALKYKYYILRHKKKGISIHPSVRIDRKAELYTSSPFWDFHKGGRIVLCENVMLGKGFTVHCYGGVVQIGGNTIFGPNVTI